MLLKSLYGLKNAPRIWFKTLSKALAELGFTQSELDPCLWHIQNGDLYVILVFVVDDIMVASNDNDFINDLVAEFRKRFKVTDMGQPEYILGMHLHYDRALGFIRLTQERYIKAIAKRFGIDGSRPVTTPHNSTKLCESMCASKAGTQDKMKDKPYREMVGCILYACLCHPEICVRTSELAKYCHDAGVPMWNALTHLMRFLLEHCMEGLSFRATLPTGIDIKAFSDSSFHGQIDTTRSRCGYLIYFLCCLICFRTMLQNVTVHSSCEAEYLGASMATRDVVFLRMFVEELGYPQTGPTPLALDNEAAIKLSQNKILTGRTKTVQRKENYVREMHHAEVVRCGWVSHEYQAADIMTKCQRKELFLRNKVLVVD